MKHQMQLSDIGKYIFQLAGDIVHIGYSNMPAADIVFCIVKYNTQRLKQNVKAIGIYMMISVVV